jgi:hypothetical protein
VYETKQRYRNSLGDEKAAVERGFDDHRHRMVRERDGRTGAVRTEDKFDNVERGKTQWWERWPGCNWQLHPQLTEVFFLSFLLTDGELSFERDWREAVNRVRTPLLDTGRYLTDEVRDRPSVTDKE